MSDKNYDELVRELRALAEDDSINGRQLLRLYQQANMGRRGQEGRRHKGPFAIWWIFRLVTGNPNPNAFNNWLKMIGAEAPPLVSRSQKSRAVREVEAFLRHLLADEPQLHNKLFGTGEPELNRSVSRYEDSGILKKLRWNWWSSDDQLWQDRRDSIKNLPSTDVLYEFSRIRQTEPRSAHLIERRWRQLRKEDRLTGKVFHYIRGQMKTTDDWIKLRDLQRRFTKTQAALRPVLQRLTDYRLILWDKAKRRVQTNSYDPQDSRKFRWLAASSWPRSPFEPYLEKGKIFRARDFRAYVVEEWAKTGAAEFI